MKKIIAFLLLSTLTSAVVIPNQTFQKVEIKNNLKNQETIGDDTFNQIEGLKINDLEKKLGRKMSFTEKASFFFDKRGTTENFFTKSEKKKGISGLTIAGFTSAVVGLFFLPALFSTAGLVLSAIAMRQAKKNNQEGRGLALAGVITGIVGVAALFLILIAVL